jgi:metal transporter CNNM
MRFLLVIADWNHWNESILKIHSRRILGGVLSYGELIVKDVMTKIADAYMLEEKTKITMDKLAEIWRSNMKKIPVYKQHRKNVVGIITAKDLILIDPSEELRVKSYRSTTYC